MAVEALILALIENRVLTADQMIETTELCAKTKRDLARAGIDTQVALTAARLLGALANSLQGARPRLPFAPEQAEEAEPGPAL